MKCPKIEFGRWPLGCATLLVLCSCISAAPVTPNIAPAPTAPRATVMSPTILASATAEHRSVPEDLRSVPTLQMAAEVTVTIPLAIEFTAPPRQDSRLDPFLAELTAAYRAGDRDRLAALGGNPHVDLAAGTVRVILELARDPEARPGTPTVEVITTEGGQRVEIHHAPPVAIRPDLAAAIAATGAIYETANGDLVQVLAPFASLEALAALPDVRMVRLPYPAGR